MSITRFFISLLILIWICMGVGTEMQAESLWFWENIIITRDPVKEIELVVCVVIGAPVILIIGFYIWWCEHFEPK